MEGRFDDLEMLYIQEVLDQHGEYLSDLFVESITAKELVASGDLESGISYRVGKEGQNPVLYFSFPVHGRYIEIRYHKKSANTQFWANSRREAVDAVWGRKKEKPKNRRKKDARWYSRNAYGSINRLVGMLMYEFTEDEKKRLRTILERRLSEK